MARRIREPVWTLREVRWPAGLQWTAPLPPALFSGDTVHLLAAGWGATGLLVEDEMSCPSELAGSTPSLRPRGLASVGDVFDAGLHWGRPSASRRLGDVMAEGDLAEMPAPPATLDPATVEGLLQAVGRGWVPADFQDLLRAGCPRDLLLALLVLANRDGVERSAAAVLWLALLVQSVEPQRLDPPASPRYLEVLGERRWRRLRRAYQEQMGRLLTA
jgi:hypothetical protein